MTTVPQIDAPFTLGAQLDARALHPELRRADRDPLRRRRLELPAVSRRGGALRALPAAPARADRRRSGPVTWRCCSTTSRSCSRCYAGCGFAGLTLFGVNTGLRGDSLAGVINQSRARVLVVDERSAARGGAHPREARARRAGERARAARAGAERRSAPPISRSASRVEVAKPGESLDTPAVTVRPREQPDGDLHLGHDRPAQGHQQQPLQAAGDRSRPSRAALELGPDDVGYACMPLFHSNAMFLGFQPAFQVGGTLAMRERFSASSFVPDVLRYGVSYWNYVGEPVHYILGAIEKEYGGDEARILREVARESAQSAALRARQRRRAARHRPLRALARARGHVRALRLDRGGDQHLPQEDATRAAASARSPTRT